MPPYSYVIGMARADVPVRDRQRESGDAQPAAGDLCDDIVASITLRATSVPGRDHDRRRPEQQSDSLNLIARPDELISPRSSNSSSVDRVQPESGAGLVDLEEGPGLVLEELCKLRRRAAERARRQLSCPWRRVQAVERLGDQGGEVVVLGADGELSSSAPRPPKVARGSTRLDGPAKLEREVEAEAEQSGLEVLALAPALRGLGPDACRVDDGGRRPSRPCSGSGLPAPTAW